MAAVTFARSSEFLEELEKDADQVDRGIVRVTFLWTPTKQTPNIDHVSLSASCTVQGQLVKLVEPLGLHWYPPAPDSGVMETGKEKRDQLTAKLEEFGLEVRSGVFE